MTWDGLSSPIGTNIWSDGRGIYFSSGDNQYSLSVLPEEYRYKTGGVWSTRTIDALYLKENGAWKEIATGDLPGNNYIHKEV
jgi:hypothetical protein